MDWGLVIGIVALLCCIPILLIASQEEVEDTRKNLRRLQAIELETIAAQAELERITGRPR